MPRVPSRVRIRVSIRRKEGLSDPEGTNPVIEEFTVEVVG